MELTEFKNHRGLLERGIYPYKILRLDEVKQVEENMYSINGMDVELSSRAQRKLNSAIGTTKKQLAMVKGCSGERGQANFHNYLSVAKSVSETKQAVLIASPLSHQVVDIIIPKQDFIPASSFFDFAELFVETTGAKIEKLEGTKIGGMDVRMYLRPASPVIESLGKGEDFISNGMYLHWDGQSIELGNYFVRLVCSNGQTEQLNHRESVIHTINQKDISKLLSLASVQGLWQKSFNVFRRKAMEAQHTNLSLHELRDVHTSLTKHHAASLSDEVASDLAPYKEYVEHFHVHGIETENNEHIIKTDINWWEFYNRLTYFATHNTIMAHDDIVRTQIAITAMNHLMQERDIKNYIEYV